MLSETETKYVIQPGFKLPVLPDVGCGIEEELLVSLASESTFVYAGASGTVKLRSCSRSG